jgi:hypothetical protein
MINLSGFGLAIISRIFIMRIFYYKNNRKEIRSYALMENIFRPIIINALKMPIGYKIEKFHAGIFAWGIQQSDCLNERLIGSW